MFFPVLDKSRVNSELAGQFVDGLVPLEDGECHLKP